MPTFKVGVFHEDGEAKAVAIACARLDDAAPPKAAKP